MFLSPDKNARFSSIDESGKEECVELVDKFKLYRKLAESNEKKLKEAEEVIERLRDDINVSKEVEKSLRSQVQFSGKRLLQIQAALNELLSVSTKQRENEKTTEELERKFNELSQVVRNLQDKSQHIFEITSKEMDLINQNKNLKSALQMSESSYDLLKIEFQVLAKEKEEADAKFNKSLKQMNDELEKSKQKAEDTKLQCDGIVSLYKKQIEDNQQIIKEYERERRSLLEEFELPNDSDHSKNDGANIDWPDSTVTTNPDESVPKDSGIPETDKTMTFAEAANVPEEMAFQVSSQSNTSTKSNAHPKTKSSRSGKAKPPLEFFYPSQGSSFQTPPVLPAKRRLFSTNCNHYL